MNRSSKLLVGFGLLVFFSVFAFLNQERVWGYSNSDTEIETPLLKADVLKNLEQLAIAREISLNEAQISEIVGSCQDFIDQEVVASLNRLEVNQRKYEQLVLTVDLSLKFVANNLAQIAMDYSTVDVLQEKLLGIKTELSLSMELYSLSLNKLLILSSDCQIYPTLFAAAFSEAHENNDFVLISAADLLDFVETDFKETLMGVRLQLLTLEK